MDRIIQPYAGPPARGSGGVTLLSPAPAPAPAKPPAEYLRSLRRRFWLALAVSSALITVGAVVVVRQPNVYRATAQIQIEAPQFDAILGSIVSNDVGRGDREASERYVPNRRALLHGRGLADRVVVNPAVGLSPGAASEAAAELIAGLQTRQITGTTIFDVHLDGTDAARVARLLNTLLETFSEDAQKEVDHKISNSQTIANTSLRQLADELKILDETILQDLRINPNFAPGGKNLLQEQYEKLDLMITQKQLRLDDLQQDARLGHLFPNVHGQPPQTPAEKRIQDLLSLKKYWEQRVQQARRTVRNFANDPAAQYPLQQLHEILAELDELRRPVAAPGAPPGDATALVLAHSREDLVRLEKQSKSLLGQLQESTPQFQRFLTLLNDRQQKAESIGTMRERLADFDLLSRTQNRPVQVLQAAAEPTVPVRPNRLLYLALVTVAGLGAGVGLVVLLEHVDHSVKVPEQLAAGLALPLFGVIPRMKRVARLHRGGHLWTPGDPGSIEADAYRNLRASLLGLTSPRGPVVTLLVTSAKAGEGKSTTALNLAATCARAGERTLLMDVDLRRPSLAEVFDDGAHRFGLVDVLRGDLPWQRTVVRTDIPNLDFLPTGDPSGVPIEILGALELRQLLSALAGHYDRVILDGPAILGLADCRMLGRVVDSALLVVRSGAHELRPLQRAKAMLEQSRVSLAGIVFNGLTEDYENWSSYGSQLNGGPSKGWDAAPHEPAALTAAGSPGA